VLSESLLILQCAHQISRRSVDIPLGPSSMNTPHAIYPIERSCSNLKRKRAAPLPNLGACLRIGATASSGTELRSAGHPVKKRVVRLGGESG